MPSFDVVLEPNLVEVRNAVDQTAKEIGTRFDFKGTSAKAELADKTITLHGDSDFQLKQVSEVLVAKLTKRSVDVRFLDYGDPQKMGGDKMKQEVTVKSGIDKELAKKIQAKIKESKLKVQASIQGESVRAQGTKRDELQAAIALLKKEITDAPVTFNNFRE
jgi:cyclic-di-GMP-binding protein